MRDSRQSHCSGSESKFKHRTLKHGTEVLISLPRYLVPMWTQHCCGSNIALSWTETPTIRYAVKLCSMRQRRRQWVGLEASNLSVRQISLSYHPFPWPNANNNRSPYCLVWISVGRGRLTWIHSADRKLQQGWLLGKDKTGSVHGKPVLWARTGTLFHISKAINFPFS
jgi:hypothetical protein